MRSRSHLGVGRTLRICNGCRKISTSLTRHISSGIYWQLFGNLIQDQYSPTKLSAVHDFLSVLSGAPKAPEKHLQRTALQKRFTCPDDPRATCNKDIQEEIVDYHNKVRRIKPSTGTFEVNWDPEIQEIAQAWADRCIWRHPEGIEERNKYLGTKSNLNDPLGLQGTLYRAGKSVLVSRIRWLRTEHIRPKWLRLWQMAWRIWSLVQWSKGLHIWWRYNEYASWPLYAGAVLWHRTQMLCFVRSRNTEQVSNNRPPRCFPPQGGSRVICLIGWKKLRIPKRNVWWTDFVLWTGRGMLRSLRAGMRFSEIVR